MAVRVEDKDFGYKKIMKNLRKLDKKSVKAGVFQSAGKEKNGTSVVDVAIYNEYGTEKIPARPFIRIATDKNKAAWFGEAEQIVNNVVAGQEANFTALGSRMVNNVKEVIGDKNLLKPNAPSTIKRKGHDLPLIDTGKLKKSIEFKVDRNGVPDTADNS